MPSSRLDPGMMSSESNVIKTVHFLVIQKSETKVSVSSLFFFYTVERREEGGGGGQNDSTVTYG